MHLCVPDVRSSDTLVSDAQLLGIRNPVTHPPCCSCGSAHALLSRVEPRAAPFRSDLPLLYSCACDPHGHAVVIATLLELGSVHVAFRRFVCDQHVMCK